MTTTQNHETIARDISGRNTFSPIYVDSRGQYRRMPDGAVLNISGVSSSLFTVGGKAVLLADGTLSDGSSGGITLQTAYGNSPAFSGVTAFRLEEGKGLSIANEDGSSTFVRYDPSGKITITGELDVHSAVVKFAAAYQEADHWNILTSDGSKVSLLIEPKQNVVYTNHIVRVRSQSDAPIDFAIEPNGTTYIRSLRVGEIDSSTIDDIVSQLDNLQARLDAVINSETNQVENLASRLSDIDSTIDGVKGRVAVVESRLNSLTSTNVLGFEFNQLVPSAVWTVIHNANSKKVQFTLYDENNRFIIPDEALALDANTFIISFGSAQTGTAILTCLQPPVAEIFSSTANNIPALPFVALAFEGEEGSKLMTDFGGHSVVAQGTTISTAKKKFGQASMFNPGGGYIEIDLSVDRIKQGDSFTAQFFVNGISTPNDSWLMQFGDVSFGIRESVLCLSRGPFDYTHGFTTVQQNTWSHIALATNGFELKGFVDGVEQWSVPYNAEFQTFKLGGDGQERFIGFVDDFTLTRADLFTTNFIPPTSPQAVLIPVGPSEV